MTVTEAEAVDHRGVAPKLMTLIEAVSSSPDGVSVREISRDTGIDKSTVSRIFMQLKSLGVVDQSEITGRFEVGPRLSALGEVLHTHSSLWGLAEPIVSDLVTIFDETCYLVKREGNHARFAERVDCRQAIRYVIEEGTVSPLYAGAGGRAILSGMTAEETRRYLDEVELVALTPHTVTDRSALHARAAQDRELGYVISDGETVAGGHGVASPVFRADGYCVGAIVWTCPSQRYVADDMPRVVEAVRAASLKLSALLGFLPR